MTSRPTSQNTSSNVAATEHEQNAALPSTERAHEAMFRVFEDLYRHSSYGDRILYVANEIEGTIRSHYYQHGKTDASKEVVFEALSSFWAKHGLPVRTDYSIVDKSGRQNQFEEERHARWFKYISYALPSKEERQEVALRAIEKATENFVLQTSKIWPPQYEAVSQFLHIIIRLKHVMGVELEATRIKACELLKQSLPALMYSGETRSIRDHFPKAIESPADLFEGVYIKNIKFFLHPSTDSTDYRQVISFVFLSNSNSVKIYAGFSCSYPFKELSSFFFTVNKFLRLRNPFISFNPA